MSLLAYSLLLVLCGWHLRGAIGGFWRRVYRPHRFGDGQHLWLEVNGEAAAFTDDQVEVAQVRARRLSDPRRRWWKRLAWLGVFATLILGCLSGCSLLPSRADIKIGDSKVKGPANPGTPATLATFNAGETLPLMAGSRVIITRFKAVAGKPAANGQPAVEAQPEREVTEIIPAGDTQWQRTEARVQADTGTVDTSVAKHAIDAADRRWLLWAAIGCGIGGVVLRSLMPAWAGLSNGLLIGAALAFGAWKLSDIPSWMWAAAIGVMALLALGYKRAEWDKNGDGIPDALQKK